MLVTVSIILVVILGNFLHYLWATKEYDPRKGHNCEGAEILLAERRHSFMAMHSSSLAIIGAILYFCMEVDSGLIVAMAAGFVAIAAIQTTI